MIPEIHNIIARWNKEAGARNTGIKIKEVKDDKFRLEEVVVSVFTDRPGQLIGKQGSLIYKYKEEIADFYRERHPKLNISVEVELIELNEMVDQEEVDVENYYKGLIEHIFESPFGDIF